MGNQLQVAIVHQNTLETLLAAQENVMTAMGSFSLC